MKKSNRFLAYILSLTMLLPIATVPAHEAVYVNMDYYGAITGTSVVKGCSLNGNREFTDYGS